MPVSETNIQGNFDLQDQFETELIFYIYKYIHTYTHKFTERERMRRARLHVNFIVAKLEMSQFSLPLNIQDVFT